MALVKCPDCGIEVSPKAKSCPSCGYPVARDIKRKHARIILPLLGIFVMMNIVYMLAANVKKSETLKPVAPTATAPQSQAPRFTSEQLTAAIAAVESEPKVKDAAWNDESLPSLLVGVLDDGTNRNGYAEYICLKLMEHNIRGGVVHIMDVGAAANNDERRELGKAWCPK
jgi:hypothetical protein